MRLTLAFCLMLIVTSCHSPTVYWVNSWRAHKDVVVYTVFVERELEAEMYERIAREKLSTWTGNDDAPPLYEARFDFLVPAGNRYHKVARVQIITDDVQTVDADSRVRVILYRRPA